jgi:guanylate kinase
MLEWAEYSGHQYGTLKTEIDRVLARGQHALLDIEVEGTRHLRQRRSDVVTIFILPPSAETLVERLGGRKSDSAEQVAARIRRAVEELAEVPLYDHVVVNDDLDAAVRDVSAIIDGAVSTVREVQDLDECLAALRNGLQQYVEGGRLTD